MRIDKDKLPFKPSTIIEGWINKFESTKVWITKLQKKKHSAMWLYYFCTWAETDPDKLLALKDDRNNTEAELLLDKFVADQDTGLTHSEKYNVAIAVKSFFKHNYRELAKAAGAIAFEKKHPYWKPNKEDLRKLYRACYNPRDRSMLTLICSSAIAKGTLASLTWGHLEDNWEEQECPHISIPDKLLKGHGRGKYKGMRQETFLTSETKRDLIEYKAWIEKKQGRKFTKEDHIFVELKKPFRPLSYDRIGGVFDEMSERAEVKFSPHDARRYVETTLEECRIHPNWARKIRGRKVRGEEAPYSRPEIEKLREFYRNEAVPKLQFLTAPPSITPIDVRVQIIISRIEERIVKSLSPEKRPQVEARVKALIESGMSDKWIEEALVATWPTTEKEIARRVPIYRSVVRLRKWTPKETETNGGTPVDCQKIVNEEQLEQYLVEGWKFVATLPSGKIVVSNES